MTQRVLMTMLPTPGLVRDREAAAESRGKGGHVHPGANALVAILTELTHAIRDLVARSSTSSEKLLTAEQLVICSASLIERFGTSQRPATRSSLAKSRGLTR